MMSIIAFIYLILQLYCFYMSFLNLLVIFYNKCIFFLTKSLFVQFLLTKFGVFVQNSHFMAVCKNMIQYGFKGLWGYGFMGVMGLWGYIGLWIYEVKGFFLAYDKNTP